MGDLNKIYCLVIVAIKRTEFVERKCFTQQNLIDVSTILILPRTSNTIESWLDSPHHSVDNEYYRF